MSAGLAADSLALVQLALVPGMHGTAVRTLLEAYGSPTELARQPWRRLAETMPPRVAERLRAGADGAALAAAMAWRAVTGNTLLTLVDPGYPTVLRSLPDPPLALWLRGDLTMLERPALAIVGSRRATPQGLLDARAFARYIGSAGVAVVSGLAEGIDGAAHEGALGTLGGTVAVLAHGLDRIYPPSHRGLAHRIVADGLLLSEYPLGTAALRQHFPERNRLISGLSLGVLVVEAALGSGSLLTARSALEQGREVMALPGSIHSPMAKGCHQLIRDGATLVENGRDVWTQLAPQLHRFGPLQPPNEIDGIAELSVDPVLRMLQAGPATIDRIAAAIGLTVARVSSILGREEVSGRVARLPDGSYQHLYAETASAPPSDRDS
jgi:DNA processing protein